VCLSGDRGPRSRPPGQLVRREPYPCVLQHNTHGGKGGCIYVAKNCLPVPSPRIPQPGASTEPESATAMLLLPAQWGWLTGLSSSRFIPEVLLVRPVTNWTTTVRNRQIPQVGNRLQHRRRMGTGGTELHSTGEDTLELRSIPGDEDLEATVVRERLHVQQPAQASELPCGIPI
jgi:hypothetical protein